MGLHSNVSMLCVQKKHLGQHRTAKAKLDVTTTNNKTNTGQVLHHK